ncbi:MAG TPA: ammonium transporter [Bdellovibrionota bacterium]|jgi:Amt family ammonium transporter
MGTTQALNSGDMSWVITASGLVLLMTPGLALFYGGMVRRKNLVSTMFQSLVSMAALSLLWVLVGFSLAFGPSWHGLIGNPFTHFGFAGVGLEPNAAFAATIPFALFALFQMKFAIITPALITGAFAERVRFKAYLLFATFFHLFVYAPVAHWAWHPDGFLRKLGMLDFAGGTVVHITAGIAALVSALVMRQRAEQESAPTNIPFVLLGTGLLWFGWFGFNAGSALAANGQAVQAFLTTNTACAAGMLAWLALDWYHKGKPSALGACIGAVVALVAITPAAGYVSVGASFLIGIIAPMVSYLAVVLRSRTAIDDTLDVFPCHGVGGIVGMIATAVFAQEGGLITGNSHLFEMHLLGLAIVVSYTAVVSYAGLLLIRAFTALEVSPADEALGLDLHEHGESVGSSLEPQAWLARESFKLEERIRAVTDLAVTDHAGV